MTTEYPLDMDNDLFLKTLFKEAGDDYTKKASLELSLIDDKPTQDHRIRKCIAYYTLAATSFETGKFYSDAAQSYIAITELHIKFNTVGGHKTIAKTYIKAGDMFIYVMDKEQGMAAYNKSINSFLDGFHFIDAAKMAEKMGDIKSDENKKLDAIKYYKECCKYYDFTGVANAASEGDRNRIKVIDLYMDLEMWEEAMDLLNHMINYPIYSDKTRPMYIILETKRDQCESKIVSNKPEIII
jgi:tetratricopeptide (TPR) repeat protein